MATLEQRIQSLQAGKRVELWTLHLTAIGAPEDLYFHNGVKQGANEYVFQGHTFVPRAIKEEGVEYRADGPRPRPHLFIANVGSDISALLRAYNDLIGLKVTRQATLVEFLDDEPTADPTQEYRRAIYTVERKVVESRDECEFELVSADDVEGKAIPGRQVIANACRWTYRGPSCSYAGPPVADEHGNPLTATTDRGAYDSGATYVAGDYYYVMAGGIRQYYVITATGPTVAKRDVCSKQLVGGCRMRFGPGSPNPTLSLPTAAFPGTARLPRI